jgi:hypothetical protein
MCHEKSPHDALRCATMSHRPRLFLGHSPAEWKELLRKGEEERKVYLEALERDPRIAHPYKCRRRQFTSTDLSWIYKLRCDGASLSSIAKEFHSTIYTIRRVLNEMDKEGETHFRAKGYYQRKDYKEE